MKLIATNRRARFDYDVRETFEAGLVLVGSEVKSLRNNGASIGESYAAIKEGEVWVTGMHIPPYSFARDGGHEPLRPRKLLLHRREIDRISSPGGRARSDPGAPPAVLPERNGQDGSGPGQGDEAKWTSARSSGNGSSVGRWNGESVRWAAVWGASNPTRP